MSNSQRAARAAIVLTWLGLGAVGGFALALGGPGTGLALIALAGLTLTVLVVVTRHGLPFFLFLVVALAVFTVSMNAVRVGNAFTVSDLLLLVGVGLLACVKSAKPTRSYVDSFRPLLILTSAILVGGFIGNLFGDNSLTSFAELFRFALSVGGLILFFSIWAPSTSQTRKLVWVSLAGATVNALSGATRQDASGRAIGFTLHSNHFGMVALLSSGVALGLALAYSGFRRWLALGLFFVFSAALVASGSRAALAGYVTLLLVFLLITRRWTVVRWTSIIVSVAAMFLIAFGTSRLPHTTAISRLLSSDPTVEGSDEARNVARARSLGYVDSHPITGVGFSVAKEAHDLYLQLWAASGVIGIFAFLAMACVFTRRLVTIPPSNTLGVGMLSAYAGYLVAGLFSTILWDRYLWMHLTLAWILTFPEAHDSAPAREPLDSTAGLSVQ